MAAGSVGAVVGASFASIMGWLASGGDPRVALLLMLGGLVAGVLVFRRAVTVSDTEAETARLTDLADRLIGPPPAGAAAQPVTPLRP